jgi:hypothetical protein
MFKKCSSSYDFLWKCDEVSHAGGLFNQQLQEYDIARKINQKLWLIP